MKQITLSFITIFGYCASTSKQCFSADCPDDIIWVNRSIPSMMPNVPPTCTITTDSTASSMKFPSSVSAGMKKMTLMTQFCVKHKYVCFMRCVSCCIVAYAGTILIIWLHVYLNAFFLFTFITKAIKHIPDVTRSCHDQIVTLLLQDCLQCMNTNDLNMQSSSIRSLSHIFRTCTFWNLSMNHYRVMFDNEDEIMLTEIENTIIIEITSLILSDQSSEELKHEYINCLVDFIEHFLDSDHSRSHGWFPRTAFSAQFLNESVWIQCITHIMSKYEVSESVTTHILQKLEPLTDPCTDELFLLYLGQFYKTLCKSEAVWELNESKKRLLIQLNTLLLYEESESTLFTVLNCYHWNVLPKQEDDNSEITSLLSITHPMYCAEIRDKYVRKQRRNVMLFDGFVLGTVDIPNDILCLMFSYFDCYQRIETNLISRLMTLMDRGNGYEIEIRNNALYTIRYITGSCNREVTNDLLFDYGLLGSLQKLLIDSNCSDSIDTESLHWIFFNIAYDNFQYFCDSNMFELIFDKLKSSVLYNIHELGNIIGPLCEIFDFYDEALQDTIVEYGLLKILCAAMNKLLKQGFDDDALKGDLENVLDQILTFFEALLMSQYNRRICVEEMRKYDAMKTLGELKSHFNDEDEIKHRTVSIISDIIESNY